jgi:hypothetical protein
MDETSLNIFISHNGEGDEEYLEFFRRLLEAPDFEWKDQGVPGENSEPQLREQIEKAEIVIILTGLYYRYQNLIKKQIEIARNLDKPIILIRPYGLEDVPAELEKIAKAVKGWNRVCIVEAIEENLDM